MPAPLHIRSIHAFQEAMHPAAWHHARRAAQEDALALQTLGQQRHLQQQPLGRWHLTPCSDFAWLSVADGVASSPCAALASRSFLQVLHPDLMVTPQAAGQLPAWVRQARFTWRAQHLRPRTRGAACTLASLVCANGQVCAVNSGDARIWRLRRQADGSTAWLQVSRDHTAWQQMLDDGEAQPEQAEEYASIYQGLLHCLALDNEDDGWCGEDEPAEDWLHIWHGQAQPGDCYLLATDGLHGCLSDGQLQALWQAAASPPDALQALHAAYRRTGAQDDVSLALLVLP
mgnify:FL=1